MRTSIVCLFLGSLVSLTSCTPALAPAAPQATAAIAPTTPNKPAAPAPDALYLSLKALPAPESVLIALPADLRSKLETSLSQLNADTRRALLDPAGQLLHLRPLLHLAAGGDELEAYTALFSSPAAADELVQLAVAGKPDLSALVNNVSARAALHVLKARVAEVAPGVTRRPQIIGEIAGAANILKNAQLESQAVAVLARLNDNSSVRLRGIQLLCQRLEWQAAVELLKAEQDFSERERSEANQWIDAARQVQNAEATSLPARIELARAALLLGLTQRASETLLAEKGMAEDNLAYVTTRTRAQLGDGPCPGLRRELANAPLCQTAWRGFRSSGALAQLETAWQSGKGRDAAAVDSYLGFVHVTALTYSLDAGSGDATPETFKATLHALEQRAIEANAVSPHLRGVALMAKTLRSAFTASLESKDSLAAIPAASRTQLVREATALAQSQADDSFSQAAVLAVVGVLAQLEDGAEPLKPLMGHLKTAFQLPFGSLLLWNQLANHDAVGLKATQNYYGELAQDPKLASYDRSRWLLLWAEGEQHLAPTDRSVGTLRALCEKLNKPNMPTELRLRAAINLAGLAAKQGQYADAVGLLKDVVQIPRSSVQTRQEQELLIAATGYHVILQALADPDATQARANDLSQLLRNVTAAAAASPALSAWLALWRGELETAIELRACKGGTPCEQRAKRARGIDRKLLAENIGKRSAALLELGVLSIGGVQVEFQYQRGRLVPSVQLDSSFLTAHMPTISK